MAKDQFNPTSLSGQGFKLAEFLPVGKAWDAKNDSSTNLGALLLALGTEFHRIENVVQLANEELDINFAENLLREWELSVGIPDDCFSIDGTDAERRVQIISKLRNVKLHTIQDYKDFAILFGVTVQVFPGSATTVIGGTDKEERFSIVVDMPGEFTGELFPFSSFFPIPFIANITSLVQCLFEKLKPAHVQLVTTYGEFDLSNADFDAEAGVSGTFGELWDDLTEVWDSLSGNWDNL